MGERLRESGAGAGAREVSHQLGGDGVRTGARGALEGFGDPLMPGRAARRLDLVEDDAPDQGMREGVAAFVGDQDAVAQRSVQNVRDGAAIGRRRLAHHLETADVEAIAEQGTDGEHRAAAGAQAIEPARDDLAYAGRKRVEILPGREAALAREQAYELTEEERIAVGLAMEMEAEGVAVGAGAGAGDVPTQSAGESPSSIRRRVDDSRARLESVEKNGGRAPPRCRDRWRSAAAGGAADRPPRTRAA